MTDTHYACNEILKRDGGKASCCYCTGHECEKEYMSKPLHQQPNRLCFYYTEGRGTSGRDVFKIQCFCGTTACTRLSKKIPNEVCMCCGGTTCGYSTVGCPWYVDREYLNELLERIA